MFLKTNQRSTDVNGNQKKLKTVMRYFGVSQLQGGGVAVVRRYFWRGGFWPWQEVTRRRSSSYREREREREREIERGFCGDFSRVTFLRGENFG